MNPLETEREWWDLLSTQSIESVGWKDQMDRRYSNIRNSLIEWGGIRKALEEIGRHMLSEEIPIGYWDSLNDLHPQAVLLLAEYGVEYKPFIWTNLPWAEPTPRSCFGNSYIEQRFFNRGMRREKKTSRMNYVEGVAFGGRTEPVLHAWNCMAGTNMSIDWSWYAVTGWTFYVGFPLTQHQYAYLRHLAYPDGPFHLLLKKEVFVRIERPLTKMLQNMSKMIPATL